MEPEDKIVEQLILDGALEVAAVDMDTNELLFSFTDKLEVVNPQLHDAMFTYFYTDVMTLWQYGFLEIHEMDTNDPKVMLTPKALDVIETNKLTSDQQNVLKEIVRIVSEES
jgi:hypothetical protein